MFYNILLISVIIVNILPGWCFPLDVTSGDYGECTRSTYVGKCIALEDCTSLLKLIRNWKYLPQSDKHIIKDSHCGSNNDAQNLTRKLLVCCPHINEEEDDQLSTDGMLEETVQIDNLHCGVVNKIGRVTSDNEGTFDHYPWMALIEFVDIRDKKRRGFNCTGSLINDRYILTAAHCVHNEYWKPNRILLGDWSSKTDVDCLDHSPHTTNCLPPNSQIIEIENIIAHPKYPANLYHDIALIRMKLAINYTNYIRPICLPFGYTFAPTNLTQLMAKYVSWDQTVNNDVVTNRRITIPLRIWNTETCRGRYKIMERDIDLKHEICAGGEQKVDTCKGDSGGALMYAQDNGFMKVHFAVGVMVGGTQPCGLHGWPNISVNVRSHLEWILNYLVGK